MTRYKVSRTVVQSCDIEAETPREALKLADKADDWSDWSEPPISEWVVYMVGPDGIAGEKLDPEKNPRGWWVEYEDTPPSGRDFFEGETVALSELIFKIKPHLRAVAKMKLVETDPIAKNILKELGGGAWLSASKHFDFDKDGKPSSL